MCVRPRSHVIVCVCVCVCVCIGGILVGSGHGRARNNSRISRIRDGTWAVKRSIHNDQCQRHTHKKNSKVLPIVVLLGKYSRRVLNVRIR